MENLRPRSNPLFDCLQLASRRYGLFTAAEAKERGFGPQALHRAVRAGKLVRFLPGVYLFTGFPPSRHQEIAAACLSSGGLACGRTAAGVFGLDGFDLDVIEILVPAPRRPPREGVVVHRSSTLTPADATVVGGIPITTPARTLVDLAGLVGIDREEFALEDILRRGLSSRARIRWQLQKEPNNRRGIGELKRLLAERGGIPPTASWLETRVWQVLRKSPLPMPLRQHRVYEDGRFVARPDFAYPERRAAIEAVSFKWHSGREAWEKDRARIRALRRLGWKIVEVTQGDLEDREAEFVAAVAAALGITLF